MLARLSTALDTDDDEVAVLAAATARTLLLVADPPVDPALRTRATALLDRAPTRLRGAESVFRLLARARRPTP